MKIITRPTDYRAGRQQFDEAQIQQVLDDRCVSHWRSDAFSTAEKPPEIAGRLCYMSFAEPDCIGNDPELRQIRQSAVHQAQEAYIKLVQGSQEKSSDNEQKTQRCKMTCHAARFVSPNAPETEIRMVAAQVLEILQRKAPNIFCDYGLVDLPDGTRAADTPHSKV